MIELTWGVLTVLAIVVGIALAVLAVISEVHERREWFK